MGIFQEGRTSKRLVGRVEIRIRTSAPIKMAVSLFLSIDVTEKRKTKKKKKKKKKGSLSTLRSYGGFSGRKPVAIAVGFIDEPQEGIVRKPVIVIVTDGWNVMCYDHNLKLMWESTARFDMSSSFYHKFARTLFLASFLFLLHSSDRFDFFQRDRHLHHPNPSAIRRPGAHCHFLTSRIEHQ